MKKKLLIIFIWGIILQTVTSVYAQESTPTISEIKETDIKEKVQERIDTIKNSSYKKAFWGNLTNRNNLVLLINSNEEEKKLKTDENTSFVSGSKKEIKISDLEIGNFIIGLGLWQENGTLNTKKVILLPTPPPPPAVRKVVQGKIVKITKQNITILNSKTSTQYTIILNATTTITKKTDGKVKKVTAETLTENDWLVVIGTTKTEGGNITPKIIHVIPGLSKIEANSTPSPTITPLP